MNVLLITVDCLRYDRVGCISGREDLTPNIDGFSRDATVFTQAIAQGYNTEHSFPSIFTSTYPVREPGLGRQGRISTGQPTLAVLLSQHGFATGGFHSNPWLSAYYGYGHEYDVYEDNLLPTGLGVRSKAAVRLSQALHVVSPYLPADRITSQALTWIKQQRGPFFAWIHYMDAHGPYRISQRLPAALSHLLSWPLYRKAQSQPEKVTDSERRKLLRHYEGGVRFVDQAWGRLEQELKASGQLADTLVVITADHGEAFGEHGTYTHGIEGLFDEVLRVPLIVRVPGRQTVTRVGGQTELTAIVPTVLDLLGLPAPEHVVGRSAVPWLAGEVAATEPINQEAIASGGVSEQWASVAVRTQEWKYILRRAGNKEQVRSQLYHLAKDPGEREECGQSHPDVLALMDHRAEAHIQDLLKKIVPAEEAEEELPDEVVARLQALGYMD